MDTKSVSYKTKHLLNLKTLDERNSKAQVNEENSGQ